LVRRRKGNSGEDFKKLVGEVEGDATTQCGCEATSESNLRSPS